MSIPDEAVEAAAKANYEARTGKEWRFLDNFQRPIEISWMRRTLEAAAPYMHDRAAETRLLAIAWEEGALSAITSTGTRLTNPYRSQA